MQLSPLSQACVAKILPVLPKSFQFNIYCIGSMPICFVPNFPTKCKIKD